MEIIYSPQFAKEYRKIPQQVKLKAEKREKIFRLNPFDPQLKTHRLSGKLKDFWSFSIDYHYRIIFQFESESTIWFLSVGTHQIYK
ncbi:MAG: type II toxin-antitoxin system mRNA interferase toxin, RelE/StbE family [Candidatus Shapirobacteria bacterium]|jgi:addiction module RelE/StbE family toxin